MKNLVKYNRFDIIAIVDQALRKNRVDSETALDLLVELERQLSDDEKTMKIIKHSSTRVQ